MPLHLLLNFVFIKHRENYGKIPKRILKMLVIIYSIPEKKHLRYYFDVTLSKYLHLDGSPTRLNPWNTWTYYVTSPVFTLSVTFHNRQNNFSWEEIFLRTIPELMGVILQRAREMTIRIMHISTWIYFWYYYCTHIVYIYTYTYILKFQAKDDMCCKEYF